MCPKMRKIFQIPQIPLILGKANVLLNDCSFPQKRQEKPLYFLMWSRECDGRAGLFVVDEIIISLARMMINRRKMSRNDEDSRNSSDSRHSLLD